MTANANQPVADVCLVLEGTYPYVLGGVSSWVDQIIKGLPELKFALFFIGSKKADAQKTLYQLPPNVVSLTEHYLHDRLSDEELCPGDAPAALRARVYRALRLFYLAKGQTAQIKEFWNLAEALRAAGDDFTFGNLLRDQEAWEVLQDVYDAFAPGESFIDFFWTSRFLHLPIWSLWKALPRVPRAKLYHSISTGYAGFLGALAARFNQLPYLITEHGIYTKERLAEISQADWIYEPDNYQINYSEGLGKLKQMWMAMFTFVGQVAYNEADQIITLYEGNTYVQIEFGADSKKLAVIPNGIEPSRFDAIYKGQMERWQSSPPVKSIGFIGRIVPIKDVKTLVRAARFVCDRMPEARFLLAGPFAEDPAYFDECQKIAKLLHIEDKVQFMGMQKIMEVLPQMDLLVLTSISEGLPLVCLEGMAAGLPQVATDVGACRELIFGRTPEDRALGRAGRLTKILSPQETASALITLLRSPALMRECGKAGRDRAEQFYSMRSMLQGYRDLYSGLISAGKTPPPNEVAALPEPVQIPPATPVAFGRKSRTAAPTLEEIAPERGEAPPGGKPPSFGKRVREKPKAN